MQGQAGQAGERQSESGLSVGCKESDGEAQPPHPTPSVQCTGIRLQNK